MLCLVRLWLRSDLEAWGASGRQGVRARIAAIAFVALAPYRHFYGKTAYGTTTPIYERLLRLLTYIVPYYCCPLTITDITPS